MTNANKAWRKSDETKLTENVNEYLKTEEWEKAFELVSIDLGRTIRGCKDRWNLINNRKRKKVFIAPTIIPVAASNIDHPQHYNAGSKEVIDIMQDSMTAEQFEGFLVGNILKYVMRYPYKKNVLDDVLKAKWYLNKLIEVKGQDYINTIEG